VGSHPGRPVVRASGIPDSRVNVASAGTARHADRLPPAEPREHSGVVRAKRWQNLSPRTRRLIVAGGTVEGILKIAALIDLARRPSGQTQKRE
jgi:hypothetical protein